MGGLLSAHRDVFDQVLKHFSMSARLRARHQKKNLKLQKSDAIILRYPKSGVTWLRVMISHIYWQRTKVATSEIIGSTEFEKIVPGAPRIFIGAPLSDRRNGDCGRCKESDPPAARPARYRGIALLPYGQAIDGAGAGNLLNPSGFRSKVCSR